MIGLSRTAVLAALTALSLASPLAAQRDAGNAARLPSVQLPPELDRVLRDYETHWRANDPAGLAALFTVDGFIFRNRAGWIRGRDTIRATLRGGGDLRLRAVAYAADGTVGYIVGAYGYPDAGDVDLGVFVLPLRRDGQGVWRIAADLDRQILRPSAPDQAAPDQAAPDQAAPADPAAPVSAAGADRAPRPSGTTASVRSPGRARRSTEAIRPHL